MMLCGRIDFRPLSFSPHFVARGNFFSVFSFLFLFPRNISFFFQPAYLLSLLFLRNFVTVYLFCKKTRSLQTQTIKYTPI